MTCKKWQFVILPDKLAPAIKPARKEVVLHSHPKNTNFLDDVVLTYRRRNYTQSIPNELEHY